MKKLSIPTATLAAVCSASAALALSSCGTTEPAPVASAPAPARMTTAPARAATAAPKKEKKVENKQPKKDVRVFTQSRVDLEPVVSGSTGKTRSEIDAASIR